MDLKITPLEDMMKFGNLDRECSNLLAYRWLQAGRPERLAVDRIAACFADIPKGYVHQTLITVEGKGLILTQQTSKSVALIERDLVPAKMPLSSLYAHGG